MKKELKVLSLFSGIGAFERALENVGVPFELVNYCEFDKKAAEAYSIIHDVSIEKNLGDITSVDASEIPDFDLMTYGFPCQDLSALGTMRGLFDEEGKMTRSGLFFEAMRIAAKKKPAYMIAENVKALTFKKFSKELSDMLSLLDELGYNSKIKILSAKDFGIPQSRPRVFIVSVRKDVQDVFEFPEPTPLNTVAKAFYDTDVSEEHYLSEKQLVYANEWRCQKKYSSVNADITICQTTKQGSLSNPQNFVRDDKGVRIMTAREVLALQGFRKEDADKLLAHGFSTSQIGKLSGNSITVTVLEAIFKQLFNVNSTQEVI